MDSQELFVFTAACPLCECAEFTVRRREPVNVNGFTDEETRFFAPYVAAGEIEFRQCRRCTFIYLDRLPVDPQYFHLLYSRVKYDFDFELRYHGKKNIHRAMKRQLRRYKPSGRLLDIGTWCGTLLQSMAGTYEAVGCELSEEAAAAGHAAGLDIRVGFVEDMKFDRVFDIVAMIDVLEHLPGPRAAIRQVATMLEPGGLFYIKVPNGGMQVAKENLLTRLGRQTPGASFGFVHVNHFTRRALTHILSAEGFVVRECGYAHLENWDLAIPAPAATRLKRWGINQLSNVAVAAAGVLHRTGMADIGPHLYVIAEKDRRSL
jgi:SAM-dependent methyltransferase